MVSVIIPTYNREKYLRRAVKSVLAQSYQDFEIIIIDDCSTDDTNAVVNGIGDQRIKYIKHTKNQGGSAARNTGIKAASGEWAAFLDSDDEWLPEKLMKQVKVFEQNSGYIGLVYTYLNIVDGNGDLIRNHSMEMNENVLNHLLIENFICSTSSIMVKKSYLEQTGGFDIELKSCQDWDLYLRLSQICQFVCIPEPLVNFYLDINTARISNNKADVISGHLKIQEKYQTLYRQLPQKLQLENLNYMSYIYLNADSLLLSLKMIVRSFFLTLNPYYFYIMIKRVVLFIKRKLYKQSFIYGSK